MMSTSPLGPEQLNEVLGSMGLQQLGDTQAAMFNAYLGLILKWNRRMNLTAVRDPRAILQRHFAECIGFSYALPGEIRTVLDFGSGAGFPGIPIAICRPELKVTLAESQTKKAAFLNEAVRTLRVGVRVFAGRAETMTEVFDCVTLRAVDNMEDAVKLGIPLLSEHGCLAIMSTGESYRHVTKCDGEVIKWRMPIKLPGSDQGIILFSSPRGCNVPRGTT
jgi:16S rRNA (guanine527-N7)-methyltransferase